MSLTTRRKTYKRKSSPTPLPSKKAKHVPKIKSMALLINAHGDIYVELRDSGDLRKFNKIKHTYDNENDYTITETTIVEKDPLIETIRGEVTYKRNSVELTPYLWTADVINVPNNVNFYAVNVPCAVGYKTPYRNAPYCWEGVCNEEGEENFIEWQDNLTNTNLRSEMQRLWEHYNQGLSRQKTVEHFQRRIHENSIRQNPPVLPIKKILQKSLQTQSNDIRKSSIVSKMQLQIFTEEGKTTYYLLNIFDATNVIDFMKLKKDYPKCKKNVQNYISKIQHFKTAAGDDILDTTLGEVLELLFSLVDNYGDNTDIYMVDHSCFDLAVSHSAEGQVKKDIYSKLTQYFTNRRVGDIPEQIYMGGN